MPLVFLFTYHQTRHFYTLIILRRLSKSHQSLNKLSHLYLVVTDDCRLSVPARQSMQSSWWKAACNQSYRCSTKKLGTAFSSPLNNDIGRDGWMETIQTSPSAPPQGPLTMTSFLENSGTNDSCHHPENRAESTADCANKDLLFCSEQS